MSQKTFITLLLNIAVKTQLILIMFDAQNFDHIMRITFPKCSISPEKF